MFIRLALAAFLSVGALTTGIPAVSAQAAAAGTMSTEQLMSATALDEVFTQFGAGIASSPAEQGTPFTAAMQAAWSGAAREVFDADAMHSDLETALEGMFEPVEIAVFADFFGSPFGSRMTAIERTVTTLPPEDQLVAREEGLALAAEDDALRHRQIEEMLVLVSADIGAEMVRQSLRGLLIGMSVTGQQGDIEVPWDEIDAHLDAIMPEIEADVMLTQRAMMFYAYRDLSSEEMDRYLDFLRSEPARKLYAVAALAIGRIIAERMETFGEAVAQRLARVNV